MSDTEIITFLSRPDVRAARNFAPYLKKYRLWWYVSFINGKAYTGRTIRRAVNKAVRGGP